MPPWDFFLLDLVGVEAVEAAVEAAADVLAVAAADEALPLRFPGSPGLSGFGMAMALPLLLGEVFFPLGVGVFDVTITTVSLSFGIGFLDLDLASLGFCAWAVLVLGDLEAAGLDFAASPAVSFCFPDFGAGDACAGAEAAPPTGCKELRFSASSFFLSLSARFRSASWRSSSFWNLSASWRRNWLVANELGRRDRAVLTTRFVETVGGGHV